MRVSFCYIGSLDQKHKMFEYTFISATHTPIFMHTSGAKELVGEHFSKNDVSQNNFLYFFLHTCFFLVLVCSVDSWAVDITKTFNSWWNCFPNCPAVLYLVSLCCVCECNAMNAVLQAGKRQNKNRSRTFLLLEKLFMSVWRLDILQLEVTGLDRDERLTNERGKK